jgi:hypothetical protein
MYHRNWLTINEFENSLWSLPLGIADYAAGASTSPTQSRTNSMQREPFQYFDKGSMATVSRFFAVAKIGHWMRVKRLPDATSSSSEFPRLS